jgi:hypothetical protein
MMAGLLQSKIHALKSSCPRPGCEMSNGHEHIDNVWRCVSQVTPNRAKLV